MFVYKCKAQIELCNGWLNTRKKVYTLYLILISNDFLINILFKLRLNFKTKFRYYLCFWYTFKITWINERLMVLKHNRCDGLLLCETFIAQIEWIALSLKEEQYVQRLIRVNYYFSKIRSVFDLFVCYYYLKRPLRSHVDAVIKEIV